MNLLNLSNALILILITDDNPKFVLPTCIADISVKPAYVQIRFKENHKQMQSFTFYSLGLTAQVNLRKTITCDIILKTKKGLLI